MSKKKPKKVVTYPNLNIVSYQHQRQFNYKKKKKTWYIKSPTLSLKQNCKSPTWTRVYDETYITYKLITGGRSLNSNSNNNLCVWTAKPRALTSLT